MQLVSCCGQWKSLIPIVFIYFLTFAVLLPLLCLHRVFTIYFSRSEEESERIVLRENEYRIQAAQRYFSLLDAAGTREFHDRRLSNENLDIVIVLVTVRRKKNFRFAVQVAAELHRQIISYPQLHAALIVCNVDKNPDLHEDAMFLSRYFPSVVKKSDGHYEALYEKEKQDYLFCMQQSLHYDPTWILVLEDDALPRPSILPYLKFILDNKIKRRFIHDEFIINRNSYLAVKLYYPLRWSGFAFEQRKLIELFALACIGVGVFSLSTMAVWSCCNLTQQKVFVLYVVGLLGAIYTVLIALTVERPNVLELLWLHPSLVRVVSAPGCCTQAMLYLSSRVPGLIDFLNSTRCSSTRPVDLAIDRYSETNSLQIYLVEPNFFQHIGFYSSLSDDMKTPIEEFLFH